MKKYRNYIIIFLSILAFCITICFIPINATRLLPIVERQISEDLGIQVHIEKLILRVGPNLKVKAPIMHMMYEDGQKFGQFDNAKFYIPWSSLVKDDVVIKRLYANKFIVKVNSNDKYIDDIFSRLNKKKFSEIPDIMLKSYNISYNDVQENKLYTFTGSGLETTKLLNYENIKFKSNGEFFINDKKFISYDVSVNPNVKMSTEEFDFDLKNFVKQMELLDFHTDIIADLKLYNNINGDTQISGLVNLDNISVLDKEQKAPKSFIYLTFLGDKIGVLSNIYASVDKKIYIEGNVNNSKKRSLDFKVKTDEIKISDVFQKIKLFAGFSKFKSIEKVDGILNADFAIKGDFNKIKSSGFMKISGASIVANGMDIKNINSEIDFSNNLINIKNAVGYVNSAPIMLRGTADKNIDMEILMNKVELKHLCPKTYGVQNGIISLVANLNGTWENITHKENIQIENFKSVNKDINLAFTSLKIDTNKDNVAYINNIAINTPKTALIKLPLLKLYINRDIIKIPETNIFMPNSKMTAKMEITDYNSKEPTFAFNLAGFVNSRDINNSSSNHAVYPLKLVINGNRILQNINAQVLVERAFVLDEPSLVNLVSKFENGSLKIDDLSISSFSGNLSNDFKSNLKGQKKLIISGIVDNIKEPILRNLRIYIPQQLNITSFDTVAQLKGDVFINGNIKNPEIVGQISVQNIINQFLQLAINNVTLDFNKNIAVLNAPQIKISDSVMGVNSTFSTDFTSKNLLVKNITIKSKYLNTDTFMMYKDIPAFNLMPVIIRDGKIYAERALVSLYNSSLNLSALSADFSLNGSDLNMKNISSELYNGKMSGDCTFSLKDESFKTNMQVRGVSAAPIFDLISTRKESINGTMDFDSQISGNLSSQKTLNGDIKFIVHNGRMSTLGKLEHLLYAQNVIADNMLRTSLSVVTKAITLRDTGLFKYLRGDIALKDGIANIKLLQSQGPLMALFIKGTYNPETDNAKLTVLGRLSDEIISGLGAFGDFSLNKLMIMLTGEDTKHQVLPEDFDKIPQLSMKNTKEFRSVINGVVDKPSSVILFNWISYSEKSYRQKEIPNTNIKVPEFIERLPY